jgi:hypothetical protein
LTALDRIVFKRWKFISLESDRTWEDLRSSGRFE